MNRAWKQVPLSMALSTCAGIGHIPGGPGTYAAVVATPVLLWTGIYGSWPALVAWLVAVVGTSIAATRACEALNEPDSGKVVSDEVLGVWTAMLPFAQISTVQAVVLLVLFRIFDIAKPGPVGWADRHVKGGFGVMLDDLIAGAMAATALAILRLAL